MKPINRRDTLKLTGAAVIGLAIPATVQAQDAECVALYRRFTRAAAATRAYYESGKIQAADTARNSAAFEAAEAEWRVFYDAQAEAFEALRTCEPRTLYGVALKVLAIDGHLPDGVDYLAHQLPPGCDPEVPMIASAVHDVQRIVGRV